MGRLRNRVYIDGGGSATIFAADTSYRWNLVGFGIGWANMTNSATVSLMEIDSTNSGVMLRFQTSTTSGFVSMYLGECGEQASAGATRLILNLPTLAGTFTGVFTGYMG